MKKQVWKGLVAGAATGMVVSWAVKRFYELGRESSLDHSIVPYLIGVGAGATYGALVLREGAPSFARIPMGAAMWLGKPERTAGAPKGGANLGEKARNAAMRMAATGLQKVAERTLFT